MSASEQLNSLTGIRGIAAMMVVFTHIIDNAHNDGMPSYMGFKNSSDNFDIASSFYTAGQRGVFFFFSLSGFLLTYRAYCEILPKKKAGQASQVQAVDSKVALPHPNLVMPSFKSVCTYLLKRFFRIYPAFVLILSTREGNDYPTFWTARYWRRFFLSTDDLGHFWTVRAECLYYLFIPAYYIFTSLALRLENYLASRGVKVIRHSLHILAIGIITGLNIYWHAIDFVQLPANQPNAPRMGPTAYYPVFWYGSLAGTIFFFMKQNGYTLSHPKGRKQTLIFYAIELLTYVMLSLIALSNRPTSVGILGTDTVLSTGSFVNLSPFCCLLILLLAITKDQTSLGKFFCCNFFMFTGKISYSMYLFNYTPISLVMNKLQLTGIEGVVVVMFFECLLGWLLHFLVEERGVRFGNKVIKKIFAPKIKRKEEANGKEFAKGKAEFTDLEAPTPLMKIDFVATALPNQQVDCISEKIEEDSAKKKTFSKQSSSGSSGDGSAENPELIMSPEQVIEQKGLLVKVEA